ncbi:MAG: hypothetical protein A2V88_04775 [Elusimicrobia bacterium RBG_16_66_12]|nr:MAG: hypothetical protein A2V88_04775 [Elusimicrobia bacterium RBG_16_66_12]
MILYCNTGGPSSRTRVEHVVSSLLGGDGLARCPHQIRWGLDFEGRDPITVLHELLASEGFADAEALRETVSAVGKRLICRPDKAPPLVVSSAPAMDVLSQAMMLGLCTATLYNPSRPVLWTQASLTRRLELFDPEGFYS